MLYRKAGKQLKIIGEMSAEDFKKMLEKMKKEGKSGRDVDSDLAILVRGLKAQDLKKKIPRQNSRDCGRA